MTAEPSFSRISVTSDEDDDIVIQIGAPEAAAEVEAAAAGSVAPAAADEPAVEPERERAFAPAAAAVVESERAVPLEPERAPEAADTYRPTTLEDIESSKMPTMQKIVIAVAVLAIVAFVVWNVLVR